MWSTTKPFFLSFLKTTLGLTTGSLGIFEDAGNDLDLFDDLKAGEERQISFFGDDEIALDGLLNVFEGGRFGFPFGNTAGQRRNDHGVAAVWLFG